MVEQDLEGMRQQIAALQKELEEKEKELKIKQRSEDHVESRNLQSEEEKGTCTNMHPEVSFRIWVREHARKAVHLHRSLPNVYCVVFVSLGAVPIERFISQAITPTCNHSPHMSIT